MPIEVELPDGEIAEFPDEMSQDDIKQVLRRKFPAGDKPQELSAPDLSGLTESIARQEEQRRNLGTIAGPGLMAPGGPEMDFARALYQEVPAKIGEGLHAVMKPIEAVARPVFQTLREATTPTTFGMTGEIPPELKPGESIVRGLEPPSEARGIIPSVRRAAAGMTTPGGMALLPIAGGSGVGGRIVAGAFGAGAAASIPGALKNFAEATTAAEKRGAITDATLSAAFALLMGRHAVGKEVEALQKIKVEDRGEVLQQMFNEYEARRQAEAGSPFTLLEPPTSPVSMGVRTQPVLSGGPTFEPSGIPMGGELPMPSEVGAVQPPAPPMAPGPRPVRATTQVRLQGEVAQRAADFEKAMAERVAQEQTAPAHPDKPLTANQLRIIQDSLRNEILSGQIGRDKPGIISGGALEAWADKVFQDAKDQNLRFSGGDSKMIAAGVVKAAAIMERGIVDVARWTAEMVKEFGESIRPFLNDIRSQAEQLRLSTQKGGEKDAIQQKAEGAVRDVRQPEIPQEGAGQMPAREGSAQAAEALNEQWDLFAENLRDNLDVFTSVRETVAGRRDYELMDVADRFVEFAKNDKSGKPVSKLVADFAKTDEATASQIRKLRATLKDMDADAPKAEVQAPEARVETTPEQTIKPQKGERLVELVSPDGSVEIVAFGDKYYDFGPGKRYPSIARIKDGGWSHGAAKNGEVIREIGESAQKGGEPVEKAKEEKPVLEPEVEGVTALDPQSGTPLSATESLINRLEALKFSEQGLAPKLYTLDPKIIQRVGKQLWNDAINTAQFAIRAGKTIAEAIDAALAHIRTKKTGIDEAPMRSELQRILGPETPAEIPAATMFPVEGENVQMRKSAERATTAPSVPEPVQQRIATAEESFYRQQSMAKVEDAVSSMSDADLISVPRDSNLYTAAKLEQANRLFKAGKNDEGYKVFVELEKEGTRLGQLINQFKLLKSTRPEEVVRVINKALEKSGRDPLPKPAEESAIKTASKSKEADRKLENATDEWARNPTPENAAKAEKSLLDANDAALELQRFISKYQPRSTSSIIKSVLQGNLLTPISEVANIVGNMAFLPFRAATRGVATAMDVLSNYLRKTPRQITVQPVRGTAEALKGFGRGATQIPDVFLRGTGDVIKGETRAGLHPIKAWINQFSRNPEMPTTVGKLTLKDRLNLAIEGTFGVPAEAMLRGLGAGDVAFREAARARATATELSLAKVPKDQWNFAQKFPELFLTTEAMQRIQTDTLQAVFQRPSKTLSLVTNWLKGKGDFVDLLAATVAPYKLTPWNIIGEILSYNPLIAAARSINSSRLKNPREARLNAGKFVVGSMVTAAGWWLYKNGLMSPSLDQRDEAQKARVLAGEVMPPNHINLSGLKRKLAGGDPAYQPGDETVDVFRAGGLAGSMFYMTANIGRDFERMPEVADSEVWGAILRQSTLEQARFGMNQSFLSGVEGLLSAVREGNTDNYIRQWGNTVASIPLPNTLTVMSRTSREYKPDFREDTFRKQMENIVRNKLGVANLDDYLPLKRGLWGEPMRETPEGRNAILYHFFDVFKNKQVTTDPVPLELFRLWRKTGDTQVIPSLPEKFLTIGGNSYALDSEQQSRYAELVGKARRRIVDAVVVNPNFHNLPDEAKIKLLDRIYRAGLDQGKGQFWQEVGGMLQPKPERAGFRPASDTPQ